jgi:hypothetical protein
MLERDEWQKLLAKLNPRWQEIVEETRSRPIKMNPDGDVSGGSFDSRYKISCSETDAIGCLIG